MDPRITKLLLMLASQTRAEVTEIEGKLAAALQAADGDDRLTLIAHAGHVQASGEVVDDALEALREMLG